MEQAISEVISEVILKHIKSASYNKPISSTRLISLVSEETSQNLTARDIRKIIDNFRTGESFEPIIARNDSKQGYCILQTKADYEAYRARTIANAVRLMRTPVIVGRRYFGESQASFNFDVMAALEGVAQ